MNGHFRCLLLSLAAADCSVFAPIRPVPRSSSIRRWSRSCTPDQSNGAIRPTRDPTTASRCSATARPATTSTSPNGTRATISAARISMPMSLLIYILSGTWWNGTGTAFDPANAIPIRAGSFVTHHAKGVHWDGAKDEDAVLLIVGEGPATSIHAARRPKARSVQLNPSRRHLSDARPVQMARSQPQGADRPGDPVRQSGQARASTLRSTSSPTAFNRPHYHPSDRFSYVLQGTWWVGTGAKFDPDNTVAMQPGTVVTHTRKAASTSMARRKATRSC